MLRELRDGGSLLKVYKAGQCGSSSVVEKSGRIRIVESRAELRGQGMDGSCLEGMKMMSTDSAV